MKKSKKSLIILFIVISEMGFSQSLTLIGRLINSNTNSYIVLKGDFINRFDGNIFNSGYLLINGDWTNDATNGNLMQGSTGIIKFNGATAQAIGGTSTTYFYHLIAESDIIINTMTSIQHELELSNHSVTLNSCDLKMESGSSITGAGITTYLKLFGNAKLIREVGNWDVEFPVGTNLSYVPLTLRNYYPAGTDFFKVRVFPDVLSDGLTGSTISQIEHCVKMSWSIEEQLNGNLDLSVTTKWNATDEGSNFDRTRCGLGHYIMGSGWIPQDELVASGTNPYSVTRTGITDLSPFAVGDIQSPMALFVHIAIDITAFLEGPFNGTDMNTDLNAGGRIPYNQPFNIPPWNYSGSESVISIPNGNVVDWVLVELRDAPSAALATSSTTMARQAAFLLKTGDIVGLDGNSSLEFANELDYQLFAVIWHRNHLGVMSAYPLTGSGGIFSYDFTTDFDKAYGGLAGHKQLIPGGSIYGMYGGDGDANGVINNNDKSNIWIIQAGTNGYKAGDFNMNVQVNNQDKNEIWLNNQLKESQIPD